jgi:acyl-[acyl-carrier-protein]-phospholipid O-acyltransferase/long-chain-fatty-acid--[acyl-carrier-protein] ligase
MKQQSPHPLRGLFIAQFFGAFNDNAWKLLVALLAIQQVASEVGSAGPAFEIDSQIQTTVTFVVFTLPLMLVSIVAGVFSDRLSKRTVIIAMKVVEVGLMALGTLALFMNPIGGLLPLIVLAGMGAQSALFSPAKYGILPEVLPHHRLSSGNGYLELWTFAAIIMGTAAGGFLLEFTASFPWVAGLILTVFSLVGLVASYGVPLVPPARTEGGLKETVTAAWSALKTDRDRKSVV